MGLRGSNGSKVVLKMNEETVFYKTRLDAELHRNKGERMYHEPDKGFYLRSPRKREKTIWEKILGW